MKTKHYIKLLAPICAFGFIFRILEIIFAIEPDSGYFVAGSVIPLLFNIYMILAVLFFMSVIFFTKTEKKPVRGRFVKFTTIDNLFTMLSAIFILAGTLETFVNKYFIESTISNFKVLLTDINFYTMIAALLSTFFLVQFATSPKTVNKHGFFTVLSLSVPIYYVLRLFERFTDMSSILSHSYGTYTIVFLSFLTLAFINLSKVIAGSLSRKYLIAFSLCAVFMGTIHLAECIMSFIPGNPYNISINLLTYLADLFICLMLISILMKMMKKPKDRVRKTKKTLEENSNNEEDEQEEALNTTEDDETTEFTEELIISPDKTKVSRTEKAEKEIKEEIIVKPVEDKKEEISEVKVGEKKESSVIEEKIEEKKEEEPSEEKTSVISEEKLD